MEYPHYLESIPFDPEENDVLTLGCQLAVLEEIVPESKQEGIRSDFPEPLPKSFQVGLLLLDTPRLQSVGPDGLEILQGGWCDLQPHEPERTASMN